MADKSTINIKIKEEKGWLVDMRDVLKDPGLLVLIIVVFLVFIALIIYPFSKIAMLPTLAEWQAAFTSSKVLTAFRNTIVSSFLSTVTATVLGFLFAYAMNYTNIPGKKFFRVVALLPNMAPPL